MNLIELVNGLEKVIGEEGDEIEVCVYDSVLEDYTSRLLMEIIDDDHYMDENGKIVAGRRILLL